MRWNKVWLGAGALALLGLLGCQRPAADFGELSRAETPLSPDSGWLLDAESYYASAHGDLECTECHQEMMAEDEAYPHGVAPLMRDYEFDEKACQRCHAKAFRQASLGVHAKAAEDEQRARERGMNPASFSRFGVLAPRCPDCHPIHERSPQGEE
jgi:hypothetical protein